MSNPTATTPNRKTHLEIDLPETVLTREAFHIWRHKSQIASISATGASGGAAGFINMRHWSTGCWTLKPVQEDLFNLQERVPAEGAQTLIFKPNDLISDLATVAISTISKALWIIRDPTTLGLDDHIPGAPADGSTAEMIYQKIVTAGGTWALSLPAANKVPITSTYPMDRIMESKFAMPEDQGYCVRFLVPGTPMHFPDYIHVFYMGQYAFVFRGSGICEIWEAARASATDSSYAWFHRDNFRYCRQGQVCGISHVLLFFPHTGSKGERYIAITGNHLDAATSGVAGANPGSAKHARPQEYIYKSDPALRGGSPEEAPGHVTKAAQWHLDCRRDLRVLFQVSRLGFATGGILDDHPAVLSLPLGSATVKTQLITGPVPTGASIAVAVKDAGTGGATSSTTRRIFAQYTLTGTGLNTPILWACGLEVPFQRDVNATESFSPAVITQVKVNDSDADISQQQGTINVSDLAYAMPQLVRRGWFSARLYSDWVDPDSGDPLTVGLMRGYIARPKSRRRGRFDPASLRTGDPALYKGIKSGGMGTGAYSVYPSPNWRDYKLFMVGPWARLHRKIWTGWRQGFSVDDAAPAGKYGNKPPWKVTDVLKYLLQSAGVPDAEIAIQDSPVRLWPGIDSGQDEWFIDTKANLADAVQALALSYLGATLYYDMTHGTLGAFILLYPPPASLAAMWNFNTYAASDTRPPHFMGAYADKTCVIFGQIERTVVPPEFSSVLVMNALPLQGSDTRFKWGTYIPNPKGFQVPGFPAPDMTHPDYLGYEEPLRIIDGSLAGDEFDGTHDGTSAATRWTARRYFDFCCHGELIDTFKAPLVFVKDATTNKYRPLRRYDPVNMNGIRCYMKTCNPNYRVDPHMLADYEVISREVV